MHVWWIAVSIACGPCDITTVLSYRSCIAIQHLFNSIHGWWVPGNWKRMDRSSVVYAYAVHAYACICMHILSSHNELIEMEEHSMIFMHTMFPQRYNFLRYAHTYVHTYMQYTRCMDVHMRACIHTCMRVRMHAFMHVCMHVCMCFAYTYVHTCMNTYIYSNAGVLKCKSRGQIWVGWSASCPAATC